MPFFPCWVKSEAQSVAPFKNNLPEILWSCSSLPEDLRSLLDPGHFGDVGDETDDGVLHPPVDRHEPMRRVFTKAQHALQAACTAEPDRCLLRYLLRNSTNGW